jgi:hypothetical protein
MAALDWVHVFITPLERLQLPYMVTGSVATMVYGEPRLTMDVDLVVDLTSDGVLRFVGEFTESEFYVPPVDVMQREAARDVRGHFNVIHLATGMKADFYPVGRDPVHAWAIARCRRLVIEGQEVSVAPPEYVILRKLEYFREGQSGKHLRDIAAVLRSVGEIDPWIEGQVDRLGLRSTWDALRAESNRTD